jgi:DNA-binding response OmpR family regulator
MREALLVDDDRGFVETLATLLRFEGYAVIPEFTFDSAVRYPVPLPLRF